MASVLVTGASGRLGRPLLAAFAASGHRAAGCSLRPGNLASADLRVPEQLRAVLGDHRPVDVVVHLAARAHTGAWSDPEALREVNVQGTRNLLAEAARAGVEHFVLASSIDVYSPQVLLAGPVDEATPPAPATPYGRSKAEAEEAVAEWADRFARVSMLRLAPLYGESLLADLRKRLVLVAGVGYRWASTRPRHSLCHLDNAVEAVLKIAERQDSGPAIFNVRDASHASQDLIRRYLAKADRAPAIEIPLPALLVRPLLALAASARSPLSPMLRSHVVKAFGQSLVQMEPLRALGYHGGRGLPSLANRSRAADRPCTSS